MHETTEQLPVFFRLGISYVSFRLQYHSNALKKTVTFFLFAASYLQKLPNMLWLL